MQSPCRWGLQRKFKWFSPPVRPGLLDYIRALLLLLLLLFRRFRRFRNCGPCRASTASSVGRQLQARDQTSTASSRSLWGLPDLNCKLAIAVGPASSEGNDSVKGLIQSKTDPVAVLSKLSCWVAAAPRRQQKPTFSSRSQWALPDLNCKLAIVDWWEPQTPKREPKTPWEPDTPLWEPQTPSRELKTPFREKITTETRNTIPGTGYTQPQFPPGSWHACSWSTRSWRSTSRGDWVKKLVFSTAWQRWAKQRRHWKHLSRCVMRPRTWTSSRRPFVFGRIADRDHEAGAWKRPTSVVQGQHVQDEQHGWCGAYTGDYAALLAVAHRRGGPLAPQYSGKNIDDVDTRSQPEVEGYGQRRERQQRSRKDWRFTSRTTSQSSHFDQAVQTLGNRCRLQIGTDVQVCARLGQAHRQVLKMLCVQQHQTHGKAMWCCPRWKRRLTHVAYDREVHWQGPAKSKGKGKSTENTAPEGQDKAAVKTQQVVESTSSDGTTSAPTTSTVAPASTSSSTTSTGGVMEDITTLLKSLQVTQGGGQEPGLWVCQVRKLQTHEEMTTLLDRGATHCLRQTRGGDDWQRAQPVTVKLATGAVQLRQCKETGTLLTMEPVQAVVPVSKMLQTGYNMMWRWKMRNTNGYQSPWFKDVQRWTRSVATCSWTWSRLRRRRRQGYLQSWGRSWNPRRSMRWTLQKHRRCFQKFQPAWLRT